MHFFEDEHTFKTENTKSFITKNYDTVIRKLKELNIDINTNTKEHNHYYNINGLIFKDYIEAYNYCMKKHLNPYKIKRSTLLNNELQYLKNIINNKAG
ncbi:hypothetical protein [Clostridium perfringens]|uniref:hypothetical protein n=1 Tax=Clostridium perfringens TaxID=1502 RepID=UPI0024BCB519|nr:hypothetical protein [Clostridium perfringens]